VYERKNLELPDVASSQKCSLLPVVYSVPELWCRHMNFWWMVNPFLWFTSNDWCVIDSIWERVDDRQKHLPFRWFPLVKLKTLTDSFERTLLLPFLIAFFFLSLFLLFNSNHCSRVGINLAVAEELLL